MDNLFQIQRVITEEHNGMLIREFLFKELGISRRALTDIKFSGGDILINDNHVTVRERLNVGDLVTVKFPPEQRNESIIPENIPLNIVYEDEYILVIDKEPYMATIPSREHPNQTVANGLQYYYDEIGLAATIHIVNRLDRDTSGLLIVAKNRHVHHLFSLEQKQGTIDRQYEAIVHGIIEEKNGIINAPIGRKQTSIIEREVRADGQLAVTHYEVVRTFNNRTWVALKLETGRTHQIRVHMAHIGYPLLGDVLYGGTQQLITRQALHSKSLQFYHPLLKENVQFTAPLPEDMQLLTI
ncbi:RluA family pseudouridine synthase [Calidifontibacillus oryziterrae]|uniref:RluA family pseudouridine synthase n=1 Tax=Calidifontibacillus oryziterrae TaxID=1191699 RepID=UPI0002EDB57E|nr:RluA family pseudouridine synthase [Calidifontibacillus oryziterrae]